MWIIYAIGSAIFAGMTAILSKIGMKGVDSTVATALRTTIVLFLAWLMVWAVGSFHELAYLTTRHWVFLILSGVATGVSWLSYFKALQLGDVNKVTPVDKSSIILTMLLAILILGEPLRLPVVYAIVFIAIGTYAMIERKDNNKKAVAGRGWLFYALISAGSAALTAILAKIGMDGIHATLGTALRTIVVLIMAWGMVVITGKQKMVRKIDRRSAIFLALSACATGASWLLYFTALQQGPASVVVPIDKLSILVTIPLSYIFLREKISLQSIIGLVAIVAGTLLLLI